MACFLRNTSRRAIIPIQKQSFVLRKEVTFTLDQKDYKGLAKDISESGKLLVKCDNGKEIWLNSGEISLKTWK